MFSVRVANKGLTGKRVKRVKRRGFTTEGTEGRAQSGGGDGLGC
jgi:hypothetical protein